MFPDWQELFEMSDNDLARVDPVVLNLAVARGIPGLEKLDIAQYQGMANEWAEAIRRRLPSDEDDFRRSPQDWGNCIHLFRLGVVSYYTTEVLGVHYRPDHAADQLAGINEVWYTDPGDLFLHKVMDERVGTCGNIAALQWVLCRRLGWPVTLTRVKSHFMVRFDNYITRWNMEPSIARKGGFCCHNDPQAIEENKLNPDHVRSGAELATLTPRQTLGCFFDLRGRHFCDTRKNAEAFADVQRAEICYPQSLYIKRNYRGYAWNLGRTRGMSMNVGAGF